MKLKIILILSGCLFFAQNLNAQTDFTNKLEFTLTVDQTVWYANSSVIAKVAVKNISNKSLEIELLPSFRLVRIGIPKEDLDKKGGTFYSTEKWEDMKVIRKSGNLTEYEVQQVFNINLGSGKSETVEFKVSKLGWDDSISSIITKASWFHKIPAGNYDLYYDFRLSRKMLSNKVEVKLNSKK